MRDETTWRVSGVRVAVSMWLLLATAATAAAQNQAPIGRFVADARVALPGYKGAATLASGLGVETADLPNRGLGLVFGIQAYPLRRGRVTFGIGGELLRSGRSHTRQPTTEGGAVGPIVRTRLSSVAPQISLNFGSRDGWSYVSGGIGTGRFTTEVVDSTPPGPAGRVRIINYGGGARWVTRPHVALSLDLRFYAINPQLATADRPAVPRVKSMVFSAGVGFK